MDALLAPLLFRRRGAGNMLFGFFPRPPRILNCHIQEDGRLFWSYGSSGVDIHPVALLRRLGVCSGCAAI